MIPASASDDPRIARLFIRLDDIKSITEVINYGLFDFLSEIGGLWTGLFKLGALLSFYLVFDFFSALMITLLLRIKTN